MTNSEKNFNSNTIQDIKNHMKLDDDEDENVSENEIKDKCDNLDNINNNNYSELLSKNGNKINLSGKDLTTENSKILLNDLYEKYPNITELDINNCNLEHFPKIFLNFKKLISFDLRNNNFIDFESLSEDLSTFANLTDLKIDLTDQNQVLMILSQLPKLIFLNGKSTKEAVTIVDVEEKDIEDISLQKEVETFNDIINKLNDKEEQIKNNNNNNNDNQIESSVSLFSNDFQNKLYEEAEKIKSHFNNNLPNYIYANYVIQSQFELKKMLSDKFLSFLNEEDKALGSLIFNSIFKTGERLVELVNMLFPKIEEKTDSLRNQLEEAWKIADDITDFEGKYKEVKKEKDIIASNFELMKIKMKKLEEENNAITQKLLQIPKELETKNSENSMLIINNESNTNINSTNKFQNRNKNSNFSLGNLSNKDSDKESYKNLLSKNINSSNYSLTNISNYNKTNETRNDSYINTRPKILSLKMAKEIMNEIYNSKIIFDRKCYESGKPRETLEQHMYTYLNQKYGLKNLIIEWASSIINAIKLYSSEDCEINLFGKILRNEQDEDSRIELNKLQENISELLQTYLKEKNPLKSQNDIKKMLLQKKNGILNEEEWKGIIYYLFSEEDATNLEKKIIRFIQKQKEKNSKNNETMNINTVSEINQTTNPGNNYLGNGTSHTDFSKNNSTPYLQTHGAKKMTRRDIFNMFKFNEDDNILYTHFINLVGDHQIKSRDKYLKNFVKLFRKYDTDFDGVLNENEFINMIKEIKYCQDNVDDYIFRFLSTIDPFNNKKITFNECISLFSMEIINDNNDNNDINNNNNNDIGKENNINNNQDNSAMNQMSLLDKICLN